jgi:hypothetical protein
MKTVLVFYPDNPLNPCNGSHLRLHQQLTELHQAGWRIILASEQAYAKAAWPNCITAVHLQTLHSTRIRIFEESLFYCIELFSRQIVFRAIDKVSTLCGRGAPGYTLLPKLHRFLLQAWILKLAIQSRCSCFVVHYAGYANLARLLPAGIHKCLELHDLTPIHSHLLTLVQHELDDLERSAIIRRASGLGYVCSICDITLDIYIKLKYMIADMSGYHVIWSISETEAAIVERLAPARPTFSVATVYPLCRTAGDHRSASLPCPSSTYALLPLSSNLFNRYCLLFFLDEILPLLSIPQEHYIIVTGFDDQFCGNHPFVKAIGYTSDYDNLLAGSCFTICPTFVGTGQQMKIHESLAYGKPVACYSQALPPRMRNHELGIVHADNPADFASNVSKMFADPQWRDTLASQTVEAQSLLEAWGSYMPSLSQLKHSFKAA